MSSLQRDRGKAGAVQREPDPLSDLSGEGNHLSPARQGPAPAICQALKRWAPGEGEEVHNMIDEFKTKRQLVEETAELRQRVAELQAAETERRREEEEERQNLTLELQDTLAKVKTLSGLLPICSVCKKIRDEKGQWHQLENYIHEHSEADFSHGLCPDCCQESLDKLDKETRK